MGPGVPNLLSTILVSSRIKDIDMYSSRIELAQVILRNVVGRIICVRRACQEKKNPK